MRLQSSTWSTTRPVIESTVNTLSWKLLVLAFSFVWIHWIWSAAYTSPKKTALNLELVWLSMPAEMGSSGQACSMTKSEHSLMIQTWVCRFDESRLCFTSHFQLLLDYLVATIRVQDWEKYRRELNRFPRSSPLLLKLRSYLPLDSPLSFRPASQKVTSSGQSCQ